MARFGFVDFKRQPWLIVMLFVLLAAPFAGVFALYQKDYAVLFTDLNDRDAASVVQHVKDMKVDYRLADGGKTVLVPAENVDETRMQLSAKHVGGSVGFELFNEADYGATEFAQKINYTRALQGELERTIVAMGNMQRARVHLVIPEKKLFASEQSAPKASVTTWTRDGSRLDRSQIGGIQRMVAGSVEGLKPSNVTVLDQDGVVLAGVSEDDSGAGVFERKREIERYFVSKCEAVLSQVFGMGRFVVSVDVTVASQQVQKTTETVVPGGKNGAGVVIRRKQVSRDEKKPGLTPDQRSGGSDSSRETEEVFSVGKAVEQVSIPPGAIDRMSVSILLPESVTPEQAAAVTALIKDTVGLDSQRGDRVTLQRLPMNLPDEQWKPTIAPTTKPTLLHPVDAAQAPWHAGWSWMLAGLAGLAAGFLVRRRGQATRLSEADRRVIIEKIKPWIQSAGESKP